MQRSGRCQRMTRHLDYLLITVDVVGKDVVNQVIEDVFLAEVEATGEEKPLESIDLQQLRQTRPYLS